MEIKDYPCEAVVHFHSIPRKLHPQKIEIATRDFITGKNKGLNDETKFKSLVNLYAKNELTFDELVVCMQYMFKPFKPPFKVDTE